MPESQTRSLTEHFSLGEFLVSQTAARYGIPNDPTTEVLANLKKTAALMEQVRTLLGDKPIFISSGYRSHDLNQAIGGAANSAHVFGQAADFICPSFGSVRDICLKIAESDLIYDQLIREFDNGVSGWCHIAWRDNPRRQNLTIDSGGTRIGIE